MLDHVANLFGVGPRCLHALLRLTHLAAATISMARVIFCVFCTLRILVRISLAPAIKSLRFSSAFSRCGGVFPLQPTPRYQVWLLLKVSSRCFQLALDIVVELGVVVDR